MSVYVPGLSEKDLTKVIMAVQQISAGRSNGVGTITLTPSVASTTKTDINCASGSTVMFTPTTASAATEIGNGTMYLSAVANQSFTLTHANSATADRTFLYAILG